MQPYAEFPSDTHPRIGADRPGVSLVIPAYNEEDRIARALSSYLPVLEKSGGPFEVIVVVDGQDSTENVVREFADRNVRGHLSGHRLGKGGALIEGFRLARYDIVGHVDADGSLRDADLRTLIKAAQKYECVVASRWLPDSRWIRPEPFMKRVASRGFNVLVRGLLGLRISDSQCGAKFYSASLLERILEQVTITNVTVDVGFLFHVMKDGVPIVEVPVTWDDDPRSRFSLSRLVPVMLLTLLGIRIMNSPMSKLVPKWLIDRFCQGLGQV